MQRYYIWLTLFSSIPIRSSIRATFMRSSAALKRITTKHVLILRRTRTNFFTSRNNVVRNSTSRRVFNEWLWFSEALRRLFYQQISGSVWRSITADVHSYTWISFHNFSFFRGRDLRQIWQYFHFTLFLHGTFDFWLNLINMIWKHSIATFRLNNNFFLNFMFFAEFFSSHWPQLSCKFSHWISIIMN